MLLPSLVLCLLLVVVLYAQEIAIDADQEQYEAHDQDQVAQFQARHIEIAAETDPRIVVHASHHRTDTVREELRMFPQDVDVANSRGWTSLTYACANGYTDLVRVLLEHNANVNFIELDGWTPIMFAAFQGHFDIVQLLLEVHGLAVDLLHRNALKATVHEMAYLRMHADAYQHHDNVLSLPSLIGQYSILQAMASSDIEEIMFHVDLAVRNEARFLVDVQNPQGWTPLAFATALGRVEDVKQLLEFGANVHLAENDGWSPLHFAANNGFFDIAQLLVQRGANIFTHTRNTNQSPKQMAKERGFDAIVEMLSSAGDEDVNEDVSSSSTAASAQHDKAHSEEPAAVKEAGVKVPHAAAANANNNNNNGVNNAPTAAFRDEVNKKKNGGNFFGIF